METTRHFVATLYVVADGTTALHEHEKLDMWLPPGGHCERGELPHETALREAREETGLDLELVVENDDVGSATAEPLPAPRSFLLEDIDVVDGEVAHQHVDFIYYGRAASRDLAPAGDEQPAGDWEWFAPADLEARSDELARDVVSNGRDAIRTVDGP